MFYWWLYHLNVNCLAWVAMEGSACQQTSLSGFMGAALLALGHRPTNNLVANDALRVWVQFRRNMWLQEKIPVTVSPIAFIYLLHQCSSVQHWHGAELHCFQDLFVENTFASFQQVSEKFSLPNSHFF